MDFFLLTYELTQYYFGRTYRSDVGTATFLLEIRCRISKIYFTVPIFMLYVKTGQNNHGTI